MTPNLLIAIVISIIMIFLAIDFALDSIYDIAEMEETIECNKRSNGFHQKLQKLAYNAYLIFNFLHLVWLWINWKYNLKHM